MAAVRHPPDLNTFFQNFEVRRKPRKSAVFLFFLIFYFFYYPGHFLGPAPAVLVLDARQPSTRAAAAPVCSSDASTSCRLSQPMKLIPFICVFASIDTGCYPPSHSPYSICCVCVVRQILISCFICRLTTSVNKQDTPPFFFFAPFHRHLCAVACVGCQTSRWRRIKRE